MAPGDGVLFYHSSCPEPGIAGLAEVASAPYPDATQFDPKSHYYDAKSRAEKPRWYHVDVKVREEDAAALARRDARRARAGDDARPRARQPAVDHAGERRRVAGRDAPARRRPEPTARASGTRSRIGGSIDEHRQLHQGDRPRPRRRPLARPRAGARPDGARCSTAASPTSRSAPSRWRCGSRAKPSPSSPASSTPSHARCIAIRTDRPTVVLPSYNGSRRLPNLTALLAMLLAQHDVPVLVHGPVHDADAGHDRGDLPRPRPDLRQRRRRHRRRLGARRAGVHPHRGALPAAGAPARGARRRRPAQLGPHRRQAARRVQRRADAARRQPHASRVRRRCSPASSPRPRADAMLMRGTEGEPVADARRLQRLDVYLGGVAARRPVAAGAGRRAAPGAGAAAQQRRGDDGVRDPGDRQRRDAGAGADRGAGAACCARSTRWARPIGGGAGAKRAAQ